MTDVGESSIFIFFRNNLHEYSGQTHCSEGLGDCEPAGALQGAGPVMELYPSHVSFLLDYDNGTYQPKIGAIKNAAVQKACTFGATSGLFGSGGLDDGSVNYNLNDGHTVIDMTKAGTVAFWLKLNHAPDTSTGNEPSGNNFTAQWSTTPNKRWFIFRQIPPSPRLRAAFRRTGMDAGPAGGRAQLRLLSEHQHRALACRPLRYAGRRARDRHPLQCPRGGDAHRGRVGLVRARRFEIGRAHV